MMMPVETGEGRYIIACWTCCNFTRFDRGPIFCGFCGSDLNGVGVVTAAMLRAAVLEDAGLW